MTRPPVTPYPADRPRPSAPTVGYICVSQWPDCCGSIHLAPWSAAECRYSDSGHPERTVRAVWDVSKGARPSYRRMTEVEAAAVAAAGRQIEEEVEGPPAGFGGGS